MHEHDRALAHLEGAVDQVLHGHALEHHAGSLLVADIVGQLDGAVGRHQTLGRVAAERAHIGDAVADFQVGDARPDCDHLARALVAGGEGHADGRRISAHAEIRVDEIDAGGVRLDLDLALPGRRNVDVLISEDFGTARLVNTHCRDHDFTPLNDFG